MGENMMNSNDEMQDLTSSSSAKKSSITSDDRQQSNTSMTHTRLFERITKRDLAVFTRQLSLLLDLGISPERALNILGNRTRNTKLKRIIFQLAQTVGEKKRLSDAFEKHRNVFGDFFIAATRSGEETGHLQNALSQLADYLEKEDFIRSKVRKALSFPMLTLTMAILVVGFLLVYVIPTFSKVYAEAGVELPKITQVIIQLSLFLKAYWIPILILLVIIVILLSRSNRIPILNRIMDHIKLVFPVIRNITIKTSVYRFARITASMLGSGVPVSKTLRLGAEAIDNRPFKESILSACDVLDKGQSIETALAEHSRLPPMVIDMIGIGEEAGRLDIVMEKIAMFYERDVDDAVSNLTTALEPILTLAMGIVVVFIALSMFLPYFNISKVILH